MALVPFQDDRRHFTLSTSQEANRYLIRYGIAKDKLYLPRLVRDSEGTSVVLHSLNNDPSYFFRVDAVNGAGITTGKAVAEAP